MNFLNDMKKESNSNNSFLLELKKYKDEVQSGLSNYIETNSKKYSELLEYIFNLYIFMLFIADERFKKFNPILIFFTKTSYSIFGIYNLLKNGLLTESISLLRTIFENLINLEIILQNDTESRIKLYEEYSYVEKWLNYKENEKRKNTSKENRFLFDKYFNPEMIADIESQYSKVKHNYHPRFPFHWAWKIFKDDLKNRKLNLKFLCEKLGREDEYIRIYMTMSLMIHSSPNTKRFMRVEDSITNAPIFDDRIYLIGGLSVLYTSQIIINTLRYFNLKDKIELIEFVSNLSQEVNEIYLKNEVMGSPQQAN